MKNLKYSKIVSETKIGQIGLPESQIGHQAGTRFPVRVRADSRSENSDPIHDNLSNHNPKTNTGRKLNNTVKKFRTRIWVPIPGVDTLKKTRFLTGLNNV